MTKKYMLKVEYEADNIEQAKGLLLDDLDSLLWVDMGEVE